MLIREQCNISEVESQCPLETLTFGGSTYGENMFKFCFLKWYRAAKQHHTGFFIVSMDSTSHWLQSVKIWTLDNKIIFGFWAVTPQSMVQMHFISIWQPHNFLKFKQLWNWFFHTWNIKQKKKNNNNNNNKQTKNPKNKQTNKQKTLGSNFQSHGWSNSENMTPWRWTFVLWHIFVADPPLNFRLPLRENETELRSQIRRFFFSHGYLQTHLIWKKSMT